MKCRRILLHPGVTADVLKDLNRRNAPLPRAESDYISDDEAEQPETRDSHRVWSKGSARGAGPAQRHGTVRVRRDDAAIRTWLAKLGPSCPCGGRKVRCDDCGAWYCRAHGPHGCGGAGVQP
jgi:hypothetical protein